MCVRTACDRERARARRRTAKAHPNLDTTVRKTTTSGSHRIVYGAGASRVVESLRAILPHVPSKPTASTKSGEKFGPVERTNLHTSRQRP